MAARQNFSEKLDMPVITAARRTVAASCALVCFTFSPVAASADAAQDYPNRPIRLIVPFVPGGGTDTTGRAIAAKLTERWGQQAVVDNRTGAAGSIGVELTRQATPDGYTICLISASHTVSVATNPKLPYDLTKDLQAITQATSLFYVVYVNPSVPAKTIQELVSHAKANPGKLNYGSSGTYGLQHFAGEMFSHLAKIKITHIPYKGGAAAIADVLGGSLQLGFGTLLSLRPHFQTGRLRGLAISAAKRSPAAPEFPTVAESGVPGYEVDQWYGVITSAKVPRAIVQKLYVAISESLKSPEVAKRLLADGSTPVGTTPEHFGAHIKAESDKWRKLVKEANIQLTN
jgi:tripartite-type tricarboxylate transporter receptor subunit TctC